MMTELIIPLLISLLFSAFFSGMEMAFFSANRVRLELDNQRGDLQARILKYFYSHSERFISTMLVGNNIALVVYGIFFARLLETFIKPLVWDNEALVVIAQTILSTIVVLFTGEYLPKTLFKLNPNMMLRSCALLLFVIYLILYPISTLATLLSHGILHLFGIRVEKNRQEAISKIDLDFFVQQGLERQGEEQESEQELILFQNALDFSSVKVRDCMIPRSELTAVSYDTSFAKLNKLFVETGYSKIPVYKGDIDNLVGYIHSSEMFKKPRQWTQKIIPIPIVPETMAANKLLRMLMDQKKSIAAVVDEFGGTAGVITMEDLFEEIIGDIEDEHDHQNLTCKQVSDGVYELSARLEIEHINEKLDIDLPESEEYLTLAGLILHETQSMPHVGDSIDVSDGRFTIEITKTSASKIDTARLTIHK
jgi:CBS domain containing-hemolysin-like protein